jgi:hypothetical protein
VKKRERRKKKNKKNERKIQKRLLAAGQSLIPTSFIHPND